MLETICEFDEYLESLKDINMNELEARVLYALKSMESSLNKDYLRPIMACTLEKIRRDKPECYEIKKAEYIPRLYPLETYFKNEMKEK